VAQVLLGYHSERRWIRHIRSDPQWRAMFPYLPKQPGCHKRLKTAKPLLCKTILTPRSANAKSSPRGSNQSTRPAKANSASNTTADAPPPAGVFNWTTGVTSKRSLIAYDH
jgi:hypothetical protein